MRVEVDALTVRLSLAYLLERADTSLIRHLSEA